MSYPSASSLRYPSSSGDSYGGEHHHQSHQQHQQHQQHQHDHHRHHHSPHDASPHDHGLSSGCFLSKEELCRIFHEMDGNNDGVISRTELLAGLRGLELDGRDVVHLLHLPERVRAWQGSSQLFEQVFRDIDCNRSESIDESEFVGFFMRRQQSFHPEAPAPPSHDDHQHHHPGFRHGPSPLTERELCRIFHELDTNGDGVISRMELLAGLRGLELDGRDVVHILALSPEVRAWGGASTLFDQVFRDIDSDRSESIDEKEFVTFFLKRQGVAVPSNIGHGHVASSPRSPVATKYPQHQQQYQQQHQQQSSQGYSITAPSVSAASFHSTNLSERDLSRLFDMFDANGDGVISRTELLAGFRGLEIDGRDVLHVLNLPEQVRAWGGVTTHFDQIFREIDTDRSDTIDKREFFAYFGRR